MVVVVMVRLADGGGLAHQWHDLGTGLQLIVVSVCVRVSVYPLRDYKPLSPCVCVSLSTRCLWSLIVSLSSC